jgi:transcription initiation factor TFIIB
MSYPKPFPLASPPNPQQHLTSPSVSSVRTAETLIQPLSRNLEREISCVEVVDWSLATALLIPGASGGYVFFNYYFSRLFRKRLLQPQTFANDEGDDPSRVGAAADPLMEGMEQLDTIIGFKDGGTGAARELQRAATRSQNSRSERNLLSAFHDISSWCDQFSLPKTISDIAKQLYKCADEEKLLRGKPLDAVIAACIFIACRQAHVPRTFREICNLTHVSKKVLGQCYKALEQAFNLTPGSSAARSGVAGPEGLLVRYCNHLDLPPHVQAICKDIIVAAREHGIADGRSPVSIAGGAIYFACLLLGVSKAVKDISMVAGVGEGTIKLV